MGGLHIEVVGSHNGYGDYLRLCADAGKPVSMVKAFFDGGVLMEAKTVNPQTITIWRGRPLDTDEDNPHPELDWLWNPDQTEVFADEYMSALWDRWKLDQPWTDYLETFNEPNGGGNPLQFQNQRDMFIACMKWADAHNPPFKIGIGSFSSGCPTEWQTQILAPSFDYAARHGHIVCLHDGSVDEDRPLFSQAAQDGTAYRYRMYDRVLDSMGLAHPRYAITEGYRPSGYRGMNPAEWTDMQVYLYNLAHDGVLGWAWFTLGDYNFGGGSVNIVGQLPRYRDMLIATDWPDPIAPTPPPSDSIMLDIKFLNQNNPVSANDSSSDCGPACLAMLLVSRGLEDVTVNEVFHRTGAQPGQSITFVQMKTAAASYGYVLEDRRGATLDDLRALLRDKIAPILLVNASFLNQPGKTAPYLGAHYVVLVGETRDGFMVHDPNGLPATIQPALAMAWGSCHLQENPDFAMLILREGVTPTPTPTPIPEPAPEPQPMTFALGVGMGARAVPTPTEVNAIFTARLDAVKVLTLADPDKNRAMIGILRQSLGDSIHIMARLFFSVDSENKRKFSPGAFVEYVRGAALALYEEGVSEFEVHNEPNVIYEGLGFNWDNGLGFSNWYTEVLNILRGLMPQARFGFPGLSPGDMVVGVRQECVSFWQEARAAIQVSDFVCLHSYWQNETGYWGMDDVTGGMSWRLCPTNGKRRIVSEFSNNLKSVSPATKGAQYVQYAKLLKATGLIDAAYAFALSWPGQDLNREGWIDESGRATEIPKIVGAR